VDVPALRWLDPPDGPAIVLLDQTRLPAEETVVSCADVPALVDAIARLVVRGAPLLGVAGAFGVAPAARWRRTSGHGRPAPQILNGSLPAVPWQRPG